jgi:hypothetical protein
MGLDRFFERIIQFLRYMGIAVENPDLIPSKEWG